MYRQWKLELIDNERLILKELGFCMYSVAQHPHKYLLNYVAALQGSAELAQSAWNYCNDSLRLNLCVRYPAQCIATAAIFLASLSLQEPLPSNVAWYEVFSTSKADMEDIAEEILSLYERPKIGWLPSMRTAWSPADDDEVDETFAMSGEAELLVDAAPGVDTSCSVTPQPQSALPSHTAVAAPGSSSGAPSSIDASATARSVAAAIAAARARAAAIVAAAASAAAAPSALPLASQPTRAPPPTFERASSARAGDEAGVLARNVRQSPRTDRDVADARTSGEEHRWDRNRRGLDNGDPRSANSNPHSHRSRSRSPRAVHSRASRFG
ncbi:hypothetical protein EON66_01265 [archaeon]|nr:MAG: hypothetical protein EON66_01265 [archaeon]